ncbi:MAG: tetraacyldisaccharide 4'-kinase [Vicinamibacterales bacterium]
MSRDVSGWWRSPALAWLTRPLSTIYGAAAARHRAAAGIHRVRLRQPVISVGNLVVGGAGKTPVVLALVRWLLDRGEYPAVLTRGYARTRPTDHVVIVRDARGVRASLPESGDEPLLLARELEGAAVLVSPERARAGAQAEELGCTIHVLDDGFQHVRLHRDLDLLLLTAADLTSERVLPAGRLRERPEAARAADAWLTDADGLHALARLAPTYGVQHLFAMHRRLGPARSLGRGREATRPSRVALVSGIARPERFAADAREVGWNVVDHIVFEDHHVFSTKDVGTIASRVVERQADAVLTTSKDAIRLEPLLPLPFPVLFAPLVLSIEPQVAFDDWLTRRLSEIRSAATRDA